MKKVLLLMIGAAVALSSCNEECENARGECPEEQLATDLAIIQNYISDNGIDATRHSSELYYSIEEEGSGDVPESGDIVQVNYTGKFLSGEVFDTSIESVAQEAGVFSENRNYVPFEFTLGARQVILGWDIGISLLKEGTKATLILPSYMGYGYFGSGTIPPNTVLLFEVEFISIKR